MFIRTDVHAVLFFFASQRDQIVARHGHRPFGLMMQEA